MRRQVLPVLACAAILGAGILLRAWLVPSPAEAAPISPHLRELILAQAEGPSSSGGSDACTNAACSVTSLTSTGAISGTTGAFTGAIASTVASGSNSMTMLDGARLKFSSTTSTGYLFWAASSGWLQVGDLFAAPRVYPGATPGIFLDATATKVQVSPGLAFPFTDDSANAGDRTVSKTSGKSAVASGASAAIITNTTVTANSVILVTPLDTGRCSDHKAVPGAGSFTLTCGDSTASIWKFSWIVIGG